VEGQQDNREKAQVEEQDQEASMLSEPASPVAPDVGRGCGGMSDDDDLYGPHVSTEQAVWSTGSAKSGDMDVGDEVSSLDATTLCAGLNSPNYHQDDS
jgi:hypothetical protein